MPHWQSVIHPEPEGAFKDVNQIIPLSSLQNSGGGGLPVVTPMKPTSPPSASKVPAQLCDLISTLFTPPRCELQPQWPCFHIFTFSPCYPRVFAPVTPAWIALPPVSNICSEGPFLIAGGPHASSLCTPFLFLILLWLGHWQAAHTGTGTQIFSKCLLRQWTASRPSCS